MSTLKPTKKKIRLDAMLSSTSHDLAEHREQAEQAVRRLGFFPVIMEDLTALNKEDAISVSLAMVEEAELYVGIFGHRYGYRPEDDRNPDKISITEMEYRHAEKLGMPMLIFIMNDSYPPAPDLTGKSGIEVFDVMDEHQKKYFETDTIGKEKLKAFKAEMMEKHIVAFFDDPTDLRLKLTESLAKEQLKADALAYYESRPDANLPKQTEPEQTETGIPKLPDLHALPDYSDQNAVFVGRADELAQLQEWVKPENDNPIMVMEAIGGMGKSALSWSWIQDRVTTDNLKGMFWYSFYEGGADMTAFVRYLLAYVTQRNPDELRTQKVPAMLGELLPILKEQRFLIVLDGLERILVAYHRWDAAQMQDAEVIGDRHHRAATNPRDADILKRLCACSASRFLITSRLMPIALEEVGGQLEGVQHIQLGGLSNADARSLWTRWKITWSDEGRLHNFFGQLGGHSLLLKLVAGEIANNRRVRRHFDTWYDLHGKQINLYKDIKAKRHHILEAAYKGLSPEAQKILSQIAVLGDAVDLDTLNVFNPYLPQPPDEVKEPEEDTLSELKNKYEEAESETEKVKIQEQIDQEQSKYNEAQTAYEVYQKSHEEYEIALENANHSKAIAQFDQLLAQLEERGLLWWNRDEDVYDLHPVVRGYAFNMLGESEKPSTYSRIFNFFENQEKSAKNDKEMTLQDLLPYIKMYNSLIAVGKFDSALKLFGTSIFFPLRYYIGNYHKAFELLQVFFPNGFTEIPQFTDKQNTVYCITYLCLILSQMRQIYSIEHLVQHAIEQHLRLDPGDSEDLVSLILTTYGAYIIQWNSLALSKQISDVTTQLYGYKSVEGLHKSEIDIELGIEDREFIEFGSYDSTEFNEKSFGMYLQVLSNYYRDLDNLSVFKEFDETVAETPDPAALRGIERIKGELGLQNYKLDEAVSHFSNAIRIGNESGLPWYETILSQAHGGLARTYLAQGNIKGALRIVQEGCDDYSAAVVLDATGDADGARERAIAYYTWAWADGEPYVHRWHLNRAIELLEQLNIEKPDLPPFDEANYEPFPAEAEVRAYVEKIKREHEENESKSDTE